MKLFSDRIGAVWGYCKEECLFLSPKKVQACSYYTPLTALTITAALITTLTERFDKQILMITSFKRRTLRFS